MFGGSENEWSYGVRICLITKREGHRRHRHHHRRRQQRVRAWGRKKKVLKERTEQVGELSLASSGPRSGSQMIYRAWHTFETSSHRQSLLQPGQRRSPPVLGCVPFGIVEPLGGWVSSLLGLSGAAGRCWPLQLHHPRQAGTRFQEKTRLENICCCRASRGGGTTTYFWSRSRMVVALLRRVIQSVRRMLCLTAPVQKRLQYRAK